MSGSASSNRWRYTAAILLVISWFLPATVYTQQSREVWFGPGNRIAGQIDRPAAPHPYPLVFLLPPGGGLDRDGTSELLTAFEDVYLPLVEAALNASWAVFRYDRQGTGRSRPSDRGDALDVLDALQYALDDPFIDRSRVVLIAQGAGTQLLQTRYLDFERIIGFSSLRGVALLTSRVGARPGAAMAGDMLVIMGSEDDAEHLATARSLVPQHTRTQPHRRAELLIIENASSALCRTDVPDWTGMTGKTGTCEIPDEVWEAIGAFLRRLQ